MTRASSASPTNAHRTLAIAAASLALVAVAPPAAAQQAAPPSAAAVSAGVRARAHLVGQRRPVEGIVILAQPDTLILQTGEWHEGGLPPSQLGIPARLLTGVDVQVGTESRTGAAIRDGALWAAALAVLGATMELAIRKATEVNDAVPFRSPAVLPRVIRTAAVAGVAGGAVGGVIGSLNPRPVWRAVSLPLPSGGR